MGKLSLVMNPGFFSIDVMDEAVRMLGEEIKETQATVTHSEGGIKVCECITAKDVGFIYLIIYLSGWYAEW